MKYLKVWESFDKGIEEWDSNWQTRSQIMRQTHGTDFFTKRELDFFRQFFVKTERDDFFRVSGEKLSGKAPDGTPLSGERRSTFRARYMPGDNKINPIEVSITRLKDDYFMVEVSCLNKEESRFSEYTIRNTPKSKFYLVDTFEDLKYFLSNLRKYWKKINDSWKPIKESHLDDIDYYKKIHHQEEKEFWIERLIQMSKIDIDLISGYFPNWKITEKTMWIIASNEQIRFIGLTHQLPNKKYQSVNIYKLEDDWWYVSYKDSEVSEIFVCDQISGLEKLIFDELVDYSGVDWDLKESLVYKKYEQIDYNTFQKFVGGRRFSRLISFNSKEIDTIKKYKNKFRFEIFGKMKIDGLYSNYHPENEIKLFGDQNMFDLNWFDDKDWSPLNNTSTYTSITILKTDDEYYLVCIGIIYILCDQLDGLETLLKEIIIQEKLTTESLNYKSDLWTQIDTIEKQRKLSESHIRFNLDEFEKLDQFVESLGHNFKTKDEGYLTANLFIILNTIKNRSKLDLCVYKLQDDWYIASFETSDQRSSYSVNFLCDQLDALHELIKISTSTGDIKVPFDYFEISSRVSYPRDVNKTSNSLLCAELIRQKIQEYNFKIEYDEILPKARGSNSIRFWKAVEFSDLSQEAVEFFNVRIEQGRRVIMIRISFGEYDDDFFMIHFGLGAQISMKHRSFECGGLEGVKKLLDDKFSQLGKSSTTIKQGQLDL